LDHDVAEAFPTDEAVNDALRLVIQLRRLPKRRAKKHLRNPLLGPNERIPELRQGIPSLNPVSISSIFADDLLEF